MERVLVNQQQAAELLGVCGKTVYELRRRGELPCVRVGRAIRYRVDTLTSWAAQAEQTECMGNNNGEV